MVVLKVMVALAQIKILYNGHSMDGKTGLPVFTKDAHAFLIVWRKRALGGAESDGGAAAGVGWYTLRLYLSILNILICLLSSISDSHLGNFCLSERDGKE